MAWGIFGWSLESERVRGGRFSAAFRPNAGPYHLYIDGVRLTEPVPPKIRPVDRFYGHFRDDARLPPDSRLHAEVWRDGLVFSSSHLRMGSGTLPPETTNSVGTRGKPRVLLSVACLGCPSEGWARHISTIAFPHQVLHVLDISTFFVLCLVALRLFVEPEILRDG